jgi:excisionase family DNA binding protein
MATIEANKRQAAYSPESVARLTDTSVSTVRRWLKDGTLRYVQINGRRKILIPASEIDIFLGKLKEPKGDKK